MAEEGMQFPPHATSMSDNRVRVAAAQPTGPSNVPDNSLQTAGANAEKAKDERTSTGTKSGSEGRLEAMSDHTATTTLQPPTTDSFKFAVNSQHTQAEPQINDGNVVESRAHEQFNASVGPDANKPASSPASDERKSADLYCPINQRLHSDLVEFSIMTCPLCSQNLQAAPARQPAKSSSRRKAVKGDFDSATESGTDDAAKKEQPASAVTRKDDDTNEKAAAEAKSTAKTAPKVVYAVAYRDPPEARDAGRAPFILATQFFDKAFNLEEERAKALRDSPSGKETDTALALFKVWTEVSVVGPKRALARQRQPASMNYQQPPGQVPIIKRDAMAILGDASNSLTILHHKVTIQSLPFLKALKQVFTYEAPGELDDPSVDVIEPYAIIGRHLEQLEQLVEEEQGDAQNKMPGAMDTKKQSALTDNGEFQNLREHVKIGLSVFKPLLETRIAEEKARHQRSPPMCTFRMLWLIFRPEMIAFRHVGNAWVACMIENLVLAPGTSHMYSSPFEALQPLGIDVWDLDFDGTHVIRVPKSLRIRPFRGELPVTSLALVPGDFQDREDGGALRSQLEARGRKWVEHLDGRQIEYKAPRNRSGIKSLEGRVYIDTAAFLDFKSCPSRHSDASADSRHDGGNPFKSPDEFPDVNIVQDTYDSTSDSDDAKYRVRRGRGVPGVRAPTTASHCSCPTCTRSRAARSSPILFARACKRWAPYETIELCKPGKRTELKTEAPHCYLLCSHRLKGFHLSSRTWKIFDVEYCHPLKMKTNDEPSPLQALVMDEGRREMIQALVYKYTDPRFASNLQNHEQVWAADFIKNKGDGQIFLLHGGPGVGKTFTAECIAEFTGRPLLALTCGDIGTNEVTMERKLRGWLTLAHKWGAVMLIDEADVFLEKRLEADLKRNSLVSVFLREVEYYQGILFLTTNRVGRFDDAFISRIHVVLHYEDLDDDYRRKIWNGFFDKLSTERKEQLTISNSARHYVLDNVGKPGWNWNGREIRNAFQTAVALAEYRFFMKASFMKEEGEKAVLEESHFKQVCEMTIDFKKYLDKVHGGADIKRRAQAERARH